jgi:hypothetical protein
MTDEIETTHKEANYRGLFGGTIPVTTVEELMKATKSSAKTFGALAEIRTGHKPKTRQKCYRLSHFRLRHLLKPVIQ